MAASGIGAEASAPEGNGAEASRFEAELVAATIAMASTVSIGFVRNY